jgi:hypothetical protein
MAADIWSRKAGIVRNGLPSICSAILTPPPHTPPYGFSTTPQFAQWDHDTSIAKGNLANGGVFAVITSTGRQARGTSGFDLSMTETKCAVGLPLRTRIVDVIRGLEGAVEDVAVCTVELCKSARLLNSSHSTTTLSLKEDIVLARRLSGCCPVWQRNKIQRLLAYAEMRAVRR